MDTNYGSTVEFSVIIPVKNMGANFRQFQYFVCNALAQNINVYILEDQSSDNTLQCLIDLERSLKNTNLRLISGNFGGPGEARNKGLSFIKSGWVMFWDSDDFPRVKECLRMVARAEQLGYSIAVGGWGNLDVKPGRDRAFSKVSYEYKGSNFFQTVRFPGIWRWAFKAERIGETRYPDLRMGEDLIFLARLKILKKEVYRTSEAVYSYSRLNPHQLTRDKSLLKQRKKLKLYSNPVRTEFRNSSYSLTLMAKVYISSLFRTLFHQ